jgi:hypothetical protein
VGLRSVFLTFDQRLGAPFVERGRRQVWRQAHCASRAAETLQPSLAGVVALIQQQAAQFLF